MVSLARRGPVTEREHEARGVFDVRVWVSGENEAEVYERVAEFVRAAKLFAPPGVDVRYSSVRNPARTKAFKGNMWPSWARKRSG